MNYYEKADYVRKTKVKRTLKKSVKSFINLLLKMTQDKKLYYYKEDVHIVVHISRDNYEKVLKNNQELGL